MYWMSTEAPAQMQATWNGVVGVVRRIVGVSINQSINQSIDRWSYYSMVYKCKQV